MSSGTNDTSFTINVFIKSNHIYALNRVSKFLNEEVKIKVYNTFVLSNVLCCCTVWHFCSNKCTYKMEKINKRALRVVFNYYESSYMELLKKANRPPLYVSRMKTISVEMYKCRHQLNPTFVSNMFAVPERMYNLRRGSQFVQPNHGWGTTQRREWILDELRNRFCTIFATDSWHLALAIRYLHALIQEDPYICNHNVMYTLVRWYLTESHHKCSRMCLWRDVDMQRIIDEPEIMVTDYLRRCNRLLTNGLAVLQPLFPLPIDLVLTCVS